MNGTYLGDSTNNNLVYTNEFAKNGKNAVDDGINNYWDDGTLGNYWDDYNGKDENDDGIGDTPYPISGGAGSVDRFPIWDDDPNKENGDDDDSEKSKPIQAIPFGNYFLVALVLCFAVIAITERKKRLILN